MNIPDRKELCCLPLSFLLACGGTRSPQAAIPSPVAAAPTSQPTPATTPGSTSWSFKYAAGTVTYRISRSAAIESTGSDVSRNREVSTNATHELLTLEPADQEIGFTVVADTFATTTQGLIGSVQLSQLPIRISGSIANNILKISDESRAGKCNPVSSMLVTDLHSLLVAFPEQLSSGVSWRDSTDVTGCQGGMPTSTHTIRSFLISGAATYEGLPVLIVLRTDTTRARGEGGLQQHRVSIDATGTGTAVYYLDTASGRIVHLTIDQTLNLALTTLVGQAHFKQDSKQDFRIAR